MSFCKNERVEEIVEEEIFEDIEDCTIIENFAKQESNSLHDSDLDFDLTKFDMSCTCDSDVYYMC